MSNDHSINSMEQLLGGARQMQEKLEGVQKELAQLEVCGVAGGGMVRVVVNGERKVVRVEIGEETMSDRAMLQDLVAAAVSDAMHKVEQAIAEKMRASLGGGLGAFL